MSDNTDSLGLPIEYKQLPQFFDSHNISPDTDKKNAVIERLLKKYHVHSVYDMTCGTGSQVFYLAQRGYQVRGSDLCPDLIKQAQAKAKQQNIDIPLEVNDIRSAQKGEFDAVISIFSAIGHLSRSDFALALSNIRTNLKAQGIYVFDIFNLQALTDQVISTFVMDIEKEVDGVTFRNHQVSELDHEHGLLISHDHYIIKHDDREEVCTNTFALQIYTLDEMKPLLENAGFELIEVTDLNGQPFKPDSSINMLIVAKNL